MKKIFISFFMFIIITCMGFSFDAKTGIQEVLNIAKEFNFPIFYFSDDNDCSGFLIKGDSKASQKAFEILTMSPDILSEYDSKIFDNKNKMPIGMDVSFDSKWDGGRGAVFFNLVTDNKVYSFKSKSTTKRTVDILVYIPLRIYLEACMDLKLKWNFVQ